MPADKDEKTEPATEKRREEFRENGRVAKSREVTSVAVLLAGLVYFSFFSDNMGHTLMETARFFFSEAAIRHETTSDLFRIFIEAARGVGYAIMPLLGLVVVFSVASQVLQFGILFAPKALTPKFNKLNPIEGAKRLLGKQGWMDLFKSLAKVILVSYVGYITIVESWAYLPQFSQMSAAAFLGEFTSIAMKIVIRCAAVLVFLAALDYAFQRYTHEESLKMTKEEVKQEYKQREGDPQVKGRIRQVQREMSRKRMMNSVLEADVVIANTTHIALAVKYDRENMEAPVVVAKGRSFIAEKVREIATENDVPIVENKPLAHGLYKAVQIGQMIPAEFYKAVAEVLAYVYSLRNKAA